MIIPIGPKPKYIEIIQHRYRVIPMKKKHRIEDKKSKTEWLISSKEKHIPRLDITV